MPSCSGAIGKRGMTRLIKNKAAIYSEFIALGPNGGVFRFSFGVPARVDHAEVVSSGPEMETLWISLIAGAGLAGAYTSVGLWGVRRVWHWPMARFVRWVLGGMLVRMIGTLVLLAVGIKVLNLHPTALLGGFGGVFVLGLVLEIWNWHRTALQRTHG